MEVVLPALSTSGWDSRRSALYTSGRRWESHDSQVAEWHTTKTAREVDATPFFDTEFAYELEVSGPNDESAELTLEWVERPAEPIDASVDATAARYLDGLGPGRWPARRVVVERDNRFRVIEPDDQ